MMIETGEQSFGKRRFQGSGTASAKALRCTSVWVKKMKDRGIGLSQGEEWCIQDEFGQVIEHPR